MKALTVAEALIALGNGEKVTSDYLNDGYVHLDDGVVRYDSNQRCSMLHDMLQAANLRIYEEFTYPMWFEALGTHSIVGITKFTSLRGRIDEDGFTCGHGVPHTDKNHWKQVEEPKKMIKVAKYAFRDGFKWLESGAFFKDDEDFKKVNTLDCKRLDYTEIEVEDY